ncbi:phosphoribosyl-AMP cyclohydrolase [Rhodohalobacter sp. 8-1]|uniref:phosphoribosyl-AMP cyclohydrolase n=1 Tax=Rhodohalobacter sp. 8-1 TaxID=3131972 RepID=UPI0030EC2EA2
MFSKRIDKNQIELGHDFAPKFNNQGLIPCITVDADSGEVLMFAWMDKVALKMTIETNKATYFSRSRGKIWVKGESSGREQIVEKILVDCDQDVIQLRVKMTREGACHNGYRSCFYRSVDSDDDTSLVYEINDRSFDPDNVY